MSALLNCQITAPNGEDTGVGVRMYLGDIGLVAFAHEVVEVNVTGALVTPPAPQLVRLS